MWLKQCGKAPVKSVKHRVYLVRNILWIEILVLPFVDLTVGIITRVENEYFLVP